MTGMTGPAWLAGGIGLLMLASSAYAVVRIVGAWRTGKATDYSIEVCHGVMGVSMAGMLIPALGIVAPGASTWSWVAISALITAWFAVSVTRDLVSSRPERTERRRRLHHLPHLVLSGAMVYMLVAMGVMGSGSRAMRASAGSSMSMSSMGSGGILVPWATLDLLLALFMIGYAVLLVDRLPFLADHGIGEPRAIRGGSGAAALYAPTGAAALGIAMAASMGYMLIMMFA